MSKELTLYKKYRIAEVQNIFNINVMRLYNTFVTNVLRMLIKVSFESS